MEPTNQLATRSRLHGYLDGIGSLLTERWRIERSYEDLKGELGLDQHEGRSWVGWHHHVTAVLACYAFLVAEIRAIFPPSQARETHHHALGNAA
jgi:SRSO17 transposase